MRALLLLLFSVSALGQVTGKPITSLPPTNAVVEFSPPAACIAWWERDKDRYGNYSMSVAAFDPSMDPAVERPVLDALNARDLVGLIGLRTHNIKDMPAAYPCITKLGPRPITWAVAPISTGKRPVYALDPVTKKRGAQKGTVTTTLNGQPRRVNCLVRSVETTSSTYCRVDTGDPGTVVVLSKEQ